jgi:hypothetical protein
MYNPIFESLKRIYRQYLIFIAKILFRRSFNYDRCIDEIMNEGLLPRDNPIKDIRNGWVKICSQDKPIKEISLDKRDYIEAFVKMALLLVLAFLVMILAIIYRINNPLTANQWLFGIK